MISADIVKHCICNEVCSITPSNGACNKSERKHTHTHTHPRAIISSLQHLLVKLLTDHLITGIQNISFHQKNKFQPKTPHAKF
jgi:hypothetical protein